MDILDIFKKSNSRLALEEVTERNSEYESQVSPVRPDSRNNTHMNSEDLESKATV